MLGIGFAHVTNSHMGGHQEEPLGVKQGRGTPVFCALDVQHIIAINPMSVSYSMTIIEINYCSIQLEWHSKNIFCIICIIDTHLYHMVSYSMNVVAIICII